MITPNIQLGFLLTRGGGQAVQGGLSCPPPPPPRPEFSKRMDNQQFLIILSGIFSWMGYKLYFRQSEMLTSNVQLGYVLTGGGGQAVQGGLSCPPHRISERMDNQQFLLHYLLQEYLVERDINFISFNLRCLLQRLVGLSFDKGWGASCPGRFILPPTQNFRENG